MLPHALDTRNSVPPSLLADSPQKSSNAGVASSSSHGSPYLANALLSSKGSRRLGYASPSIHRSMYLGGTHPASARSPYLDVAAPSPLHRSTHLSSDYRASKGSPYLDIASPSSPYLGDTLNAPKRSTNLGLAALSPRRSSHLAAGLTSPTGSSHLGVNSLLHQISPHQAPWPRGSMHLKVTSPYSKGLPHLDNAALSSERTPYRGNTFPSSTGSTHLGVAASSPLRSTHLSRPLHYSKGSPRFTRQDVGLSHRSAVDSLQRALLLDVASPSRHGSLDRPHSTEDKYMPYEYEPREVVVPPTMSPDLYKISTWSRDIRARSYRDHFPSKRSDRIVGTQIVCVQSLMVGCKG